MKYFFLSIGAFHYATISYIYLRIAIVEICNKTDSIVFAENDLQVHLNSTVFSFFIC